MSGASSVANAETYTPGQRVDGDSNGFARPFLIRHCIDCHGETKPEGNLSLSNLGSVDEVNAAIWKNVWSQVALKEMPPRDAEQPGVAARRRFSDWIVGELSRVMRDQAGFRSHLDPDKGNFVDLNLLFGPLPEGIKPAPTSSPARLWFGKLGVKDLDILDIRDRSQVKPEMIKRLAKCDGVMMSGGNQLRLTTIFGGTAFLQLIKRRYEQEDRFVIAGTTAGAMCMSSTMIYQGHSASGLIKGGVKLTTGASLIQDGIIDSHFVERGRFSRLTQAVAANPAAIGIGLGEDTGVVITQADMLETIGSGQVMIFDGHEISYSDYADVEEGEPFSIEGMKVHIISKGHSYSVKQRAFSAVRVPAVQREGKH